MTTKKDEKTPEQEAELAALETTVRPIAPIHSRGAADDYTLSHNWQPGSPAADTSVLNEHGIGGESILDKIDSPENLKAKKDAAKLVETFYDEDEDCSKLDVSDNRYCQPGSARHKAYLKGK